MRKAELITSITVLVMTLFLGGCGSSGSDDDDDDNKTDNVDTPPRIENLAVNVDAGNNINISADVSDEDYVTLVDPFISEYDSAKDRYMMWMLGPATGLGVSSFSYSHSYSGAFMTVCEGGNCNPSATNIRFDSQGDIYITGECENASERFDCYAITSHGSTVDVYTITDLGGSQVTIDTFYPVKLYLTSLDPSGLLKTSTSTRGIRSADLGFGSASLDQQTYHGGIEVKDSSDQTNFDAKPFAY